MQYARVRNPENQVLTYAEQLPQLFNVGMLFFRLCSALVVYVKTNNWKLETQTLNYSEIHLKHRTVFKSRIKSNVCSHRSLFIALLLPLEIKQ